MKKRIQVLQGNNERTQAEVDSEIQNLNKAISASHYINWSPIAVGFMTFATLVANTVTHWDENSENSNIVQCFVIAGMGTMGVVKLAIYVFKKVKKYQRTQATNKQNLLDRNQDLLLFSEESRRMAKQCVAPDPKNRLPSSFSYFSDYLSGLPASVKTDAENLIDAWKRAGAIISQPNTAQRQEDLTDFIDWNILPLVHHYSNEAELNLEALGSQLSEEQQKKIAALEKEIADPAPPPQNDEVAVEIEE